MPVGSKLIALLFTSSPLRPFTVLRFVRYSRHPFAAFSSAAVFHGRIHSVCHRPKLGFWSGSANQFHSEAVTDEGCGEAATSFSDSKHSHPWPEWSKLADLLVEKGYSDRCLTSGGDDDDSFLVDEELPEEFSKAAEACLGFARDRPDILRLLAKKNIEAVVLNGSPFLFKNGENSARRMKLFLTGEGSSDLELEKAQTFDIVRYLLSYVYGSLSSSNSSNLKSDELVERSVRKLLCELFNLNGTVWKPKTVDATLAELPSSNDQLSGHPGQYIEPRSGDGFYPNNITEKVYGRNIFNQKQGSEETPSSQTRDGSLSYGGFIANSAQTSTSVSNKNVESWNTVQTSSTSNAHLSNETNAAYGSTNPVQPPSHLTNNYNTYYGGYTGKPTQPSGNLWTSSSTTYGGPTATSSQPSSNSWNNYNTSVAGYSMNSPTQPSGTLWSNSNAPYGGSTANSSQPPPSDSWSNYNAANSTQPSNNSWSNRNRSYGESTPNSSQPPSSYQGNYSTRYDGYSNTSQTGVTSNSSQPPSNSWNTYNTSGGSNEKLKHPSSNSYSASSAYSPQAPNNSWNSYPTPYGENVMKSTQASSNYRSSSNASFGRPTASSSQSPSNSWNNQSTNYTNSTNPSTSSRNSENSYVGFNADSYRGYPANSSQPSSYSLNNSSTYPGASENPPFNSRISYPGASANPPQLSISTWNNSRDGGFPQASHGLPFHGQSQNAGVNANYGYAGKSLEGSCVKEPDPLDMSEEAKAERWFRRAAQIKDISELSQIPDEDFPQIMPMRKGVNRFVVSKRKTPLERRLASQQYKRSLPVVSSEPENEPTAGEKEV